MRGKGVYRYKADCMTHEDNFGHVIPPTYYIGPYENNTTPEAAMEVEVWFAKLGWTEDRNGIVRCPDCSKRYIAVGGLK